MHSLHHAWRFVAVLAVVVSATVVRAATYVPADPKTISFGGDLTVLPADQRPKVATALAGLVRNHFSVKKFSDSKSASHVLSLALALDPDNKEAIVVNGNWEDQSVPKHDDAFSADDALKQIRDVASAGKDSKNKPDQVLAAYLYSAASLISPSDDDTYQVQMLKRAGIKTAWQSGDSHHRSADEPVPQVSDTTKINSLVVTEIDGVWHGKISPMIAIKSDHARKPEIVGSVGRTMSTSLEEAIRTANARHPGADRAPIEISFEEKYSRKDGGSAGAAMTLLILSSCGDFQLNPKAAITGDVSVDGKIQSVGMVAEKIRGAALDHAAVVAIPTSDAAELGDAMLLRGPGALTDIQILGIETIDDAVAAMRTDQDAKLVQALAAFDEVKPRISKLTLAALAADQSLKKPLEDVLALAPNHLSAKNLLDVVNGQKPSHLSLVSSLTEAFAALGPMRGGLGATGRSSASIATVANFDAAKKNLQHVQSLADPAADPIFPVLVDFCATSVKLGDAQRAGVSGISEAMALRDALHKKSAAIQATLAKIVSDPAVVDRLMRQ